MAQESTFCADSEDEKEEDPVTCLALWKCGLCMEPQNSPVKKKYIETFMCDGCWNGLRSKKLTHRGNRAAQLQDKAKYHNDFEKWRTETLEFKDPSLRREAIKMKGRERKPSTMKQAMRTMATSPIWSTTPRTNGRTTDSRPRA